MADSAKIERLRVLAERGATAGEREAARQAIQRLTDKAERVILVQTGPTAYRLTVGYTEVNIERSSTKVWEARVGGELKRVAMTRRGILKQFGLV